METKTLKPYFVVIGLMAFTALTLAVSVDVRNTDEAGIKMYLPDRVGNWQGQEMRFCQNPSCEKDFRANSLKDRDVCPACGGKLDTMTLGEKTLLPADTSILKKFYTNSAGRGLFVSIVLSGKERASIHRPQVCLVGQGNEIARTVVVTVPMDGRKPLGVTALEMLRRGRNANGQTFELPSYFAYWFVGKGRETPYHIQRMVWMATDRILHNVSHRWAYIALSGNREKDSDSYQKELQSFVHDLYPQITLN
jgi:hypothetical protein